MIVDSSALVAMLRGEADATRYTESLRRAGGARISSATYVEFAAVIDGQGDPVLSGAIDEVLRTYAIAIEPLTEAQARIARTAYQQFGKGSGHPARLNVGDCFAYALARDFGEPLLFKGQDFALTDIEIVIEPIKERRLSEVVAAYGAATP
jgi:ribonuclease VapC